MSKIYRVVIHYEGAFSYDIKAENTTEAEQIAEEFFDNLTDREIVSNLCEIGVCDCYEINHEINLEDVGANIRQLIQEYNLIVNNNHYLMDGDLEQLFCDSNIKVGRTLYKAKDWEYDEDGYLIGCENGDYLETIELIQNGKTYLCQAFSDECGDGLDYMLALLNINIAK